MHYAQPNMVKAYSTPNIALIKYWGNRHDTYRLPAADSCSITLDMPSVEISVEHSPVFQLKSFLPDGTEKILKEKDIVRIEEHLRLTKEFLATKNLADAIPASVAITIRSAIPPAIGIASSAAVFATLATAYGQIANGKSLTPRYLHHRPPRLRFGRPQHLRGIRCSHQYTQLQIANCKL